MKKHKHAEIIAAYIDGIQCEYYSERMYRWCEIDELSDFDSYAKVRIKPQPVIREEYLVFLEISKSWASYPRQQYSLQKPLSKQFKLTYKDDVLEKVDIVR